MTLSDRYYCYHCGADSADLATMTDPDEMQQFDDEHPDAQRELIYDDRCPFCGFEYRDDNEDVLY